MASNSVGLVPNSVGVVTVVYACT